MKKRAIILCDGWDAQTPLETSRLFSDMLVAGIEPFPMPVACTWRDFDRPEAREFMRRGLLRAAGAGSDTFGLAAPEAGTMRPGSP